jgi:hypothetical protein
MEDWRALVYVVPDLSGVESRSMSIMLGFSYLLYVLALMLTPPVIGNRIGIRAALREVLIELALVFVVWLLIVAVSFVMLGLWPPDRELWANGNGTVAVMLGMPFTLFLLIKLALIVPASAVLLGGSIACAWWAVAASWRRWWWG